MQEIKLDFQNVKDDDRWLHLGAAVVLASAALELEPFDPQVRHTLETLLDIVGGKRTDATVTLAKFIQHNYQDTLERLVAKEAAAERPATSPEN